jgi:hypothetical protein
MARRRSPASLLVDCSKWRVPPEDARARLAERDARLAADTRNDCQKILGDPPRPGRRLCKAGFRHRNPYAAQAVCVLTCGENSQSMR